MKRKNQRQEYTQSPWGGKAYEHAPSIDELAKESMDGLRRHPSISKAMRLEAMDRFIEAYKAKAEKA